MTEVYVMRRLDQLKAIADPLRLRILQHFCRQAATTKQVAQGLGLAPHKLYHHVETLANAGLIELVETRPNRGTVEKYFRAVAAHFALSPALFEVRLEGLGEADEARPIPAQGGLNVGAALQSTLEEIKAGLNDGRIAEGERFFARLHVHTSPDKAEQLRAKLQDFLDACRAADSASGSGASTTGDGKGPADLPSYSITAAFFQAG